MTRGWKKEVGGENVDETKRIGRGAVELEAGAAEGTEGEK